MDKVEKKKRQILEADVRGCQWLADGNAAAEAGKKALAEKCYAKANTGSTATTN